MSSFKKCDNLCVLEKGSQVNDDDDDDDDDDNDDNDDDDDDDDDLREVGRGG